MPSIFAMWVAYETGAIMGRARRLRIRTDEDRRKVADALRRSPVFQQLVAGGHSLDEIVEILNLRDLRGDDFERVLGVSWPL